LNVLYIKIAVWYFVNIPIPLKCNKLQMAVSRTVVTVR